MSSKAFRKTRRNIQATDAVWNFKTVAFLLAILVCFALLIFGIFKLKESRIASLPTEFEGQIVDKWAGFDETQQGSYPYYRVQIELDGQKLTVPVNGEIFNEAQVGMRLKRSAKGLEVIRGSTGNKLP